MSHSGQAQPAARVHGLAAVGMAAADMSHSGQAQLGARRHSSIAGLASLAGRQGAAKKLCTV
jgi:hypothetical protein